MAGALQGVRVLDCTQIIAGPLAGSLLSEMGAEVVKVEPLEGDPWRLHAELIPKESRGFLTQNRGKLGIAIDLKHPAAGAPRDALIRWADVLLTNYRPGVPEQLGLDYPAARAINPGIICCENTAFDKLGPDADRRGYDIIAQAMSGLATSNPNIQNGLPTIVAFAPADVVTGVAMAWAISAALYHRERTGEGQAINTSLLLSSLFLQAGAREITSLDTDPRAKWLATLRAARQRSANMEEIWSTDGRGRSHLPDAHDARVGRPHGGPLLPCGPLRFIDELHTDAQVDANGYIVDYEHTLLGPLRGPAPIVQMSATPTAVQRASPALGEHTEQVLMGLGFTVDASRRCGAKE